MRPFYTNQLLIGTIGQRKQQLTLWNRLIEINYKQSASLKSTSYNSYNLLHQIISINTQEINNSGTRNY